MNYSLLKFRIFERLEDKCIEHDVNFDKITQIYNWRLKNLKCIIEDYSSIKSHVMFRVYEGILRDFDSGVYK